MRGMWEPIGGRLATLEASCQFDGITGEHITTISYYSFSVHHDIPAKYGERVDRGDGRSTNP